MWGAVSFIRRGRVSEGIGIEGMIGVIASEVVGEGLGAHERGDGLRAEVGSAQRGEVLLELEGALGGFEGFEEAGAGDAYELDLGGEVGEGHLVEEAAFRGFEAGRVEAVREGVGVAGLCATAPAVGIGGVGMRATRQRRQVAAFGCWIGVRGGGLRYWAR
jgi:hypothetical protein